MFTKPKGKVLGFQYDSSERIRTLIGQDYQVFAKLRTHDVVITCTEEREFIVVLKDNRYLSQIKVAILNIFGPVAIKDILPSPITLHMSLLNSRHRLYFKLSRKEVTLDDFVDTLSMKLD